MLKIFFYIFLVVNPCIVYSQVIIKNYVKGNTHRVLTIEPDSADYSDLEDIGNAIGNSQVVLLGEQEHGDATTFLAKSRLIKYLHEKKGFNVLAFESDFYGLNEGWGDTRKSKASIDSFIYKNVYPIWTLCYTCNNLFYTYISNTFKDSNPLQISGIDCQLYGNYSTENIAKKLQAYLKSYSGIQKNLLTILPILDSLIIPNQLKTIANTDTLINNLTVIYNYLQTIDTRDKFWLQVLKSIISLGKENKAWLEKDSKNYHFRDMQMADNLDWLCRYKYPNEKIIIWAHNAHIAKNSGNTFNFFSTENEMMGSYIDRNSFLRDKVYRIGFTSYGGSTKWANKLDFGHSLMKPKNNGFENWINKSYDFAFVDFKKFRELNPAFNDSFYMKGSTYYPHYNYSYNWSNIFDGVFFIRNMYGCK